MLEIRNLNVQKKQEDRQLISDLSFTMNQHDKFALIGLEGNGKSTLIKIILGEQIEYIDYSGSINTRKLKLGYLPQSIKEVWTGVNVIDYLLKNSIDEDLNYDNYELLGNLDRILKQVQFAETSFSENKTIDEFSGGEVVKLGLAKILLRKPDILLLDEPTNDLDLETILFLENFIVSEERPILFISHDEALLENTANGIIHLTQSHKKTKAHSFFEKCSYNEYKIKRNLMINSQEMIAKKQRSTFKKKMERYRQIYQKVEHLQNQTVRNPSAARLLAKKVKSLKSTESRYLQEQEEFIDIPEREEEIWLHFDHEVSIPKNRIVLDYHLDKLIVEDKVLSSNIELLVKGPEKICILGRNGSGKTTLIKHIYESLKHRKNIKVGYMGQHYDEQLDGNTTALEYLIDPGDKELHHKIRKMMGVLHFSREEMLYKTTQLSGGQKAKLLLLKMVIDKSDVLILDEPTRNLSPLSIPVIHDMLLQFKGCIICVSHDRNFIENVFNDIYVLDQSGLNKL